MQNKPWRNEEFKECEEALPRLFEGDLEKASRLYKAKTGVGCDGFHPKVPLDLTKETRGEIVEFLVKVEQSGKWPQQAWTTMFFLTPKNLTSERPIALMPTLTRWWEALRAPEVAKWQQKYRMEWDATDVRNGGAQRTVWDVLMEMERFNGRAKATDQGCVALVLDLAKAFERVSFPLVWAWATAFQLPRKILRVLCGYFEHQRRVQFEGCAAEPLTTIPAILPGSKWSCLLLRIVLQDALSEVPKIHPSLKLRVFADDITAEEVEKKGLELSVTDNGKEGKSKMIASCGFLENELSQFSKEGVTLADSVEMLSRG